MRSMVAIWMAAGECVGHTSMALNGAAAAMHRAARLSAFALAQRPPLKVIDVRRAAPPLRHLASDGVSRRLWHSFAFEVSRCTGQDFAHTAIKDVVSVVQRHSRFDGRSRS